MYCIVYKFCLLTILCGIGYKGVVSVDDQLEGIKMRLRESMRKFVIPNQETADIEIARAFERPGISYLNR